MTSYHPLKCFTIFSHTLFRRYINIIEFITIDGPSETNVSTNFHKIQKLMSRNNDENIWLKWVSLHFFGIRCPTPLHKVGPFSQISGHLAKRLSLGWSTEHLYHVRVVIWSGISLCEMYMDHNGNNLCNPSQISANTIFIFLM